MSVMLTVKLPGGETEHRTASCVPEVGDHLRCRGEDWEVSAVETHQDRGVVVRVRSLAAAAGNVASGDA